jgi:hypothetical protein
LQESTFRKIVGDPDFDPYGIVEEALVEFIKRHPEKVATDRVALKYLVQDPSIIDTIAQVIDINDLETIPVALDTAKRIQWDHSRQRTRNRILNKLKGAKPENVDALLQIVKDKAPETRLGSFPSEFIDMLTDEQGDELVVNAVQAGSTDGWHSSDWKIAIRRPAGLDAFIEAIKKGVVAHQTDNLQLVSKVAVAVKGQRDKERVLLGMFSDLNSYTCFCCGKGTTGQDNDIIKSLSGYTLHREKCDPGNEFPSPDEIITGKPKTLEFPCECGEVFTTSSGLSLHRKACR